MVGVWLQCSHAVELGSFIGNSGTVWSLTARELGMNAAVVCIDTWLGDQIMWIQKGNALGPPGRDGQPRLYEQFMLNVAGKNASDRVVPVRMPAAQGFEYVHRQVRMGQIPPP